jgi:hypothetical protein
MKRNPDVNLIAPFPALASNGRMQNYPESSASCVKRQLARDDKPVMRQQEE